MVEFEDQLPRRDSDEESGHASQQQDDAAKSQQQPLFTCWSVGAVVFSTVFSQIVLFGWNFGE
jgi:hypothetical protein